MSQFEKGQEVIVDNYDASPWIRQKAVPSFSKATITLVGRRWVHIVQQSGFRDRFDPDEMEIDTGEEGGVSSKIFLTEEQWRDYHRKRVAWEKIKDIARQSSGPPEAATADELEAVLRTIEKED